MRAIMFGLSIAAALLTALPADAATTAKKIPATKAAKATSPTPSRPAIAVDPDLQRAVLDPGRKPANAARDRYRHPAQTLSFFGLKPDMTVVEMIPGGGWYSEILAPYLAASGHYIAAVEPGDAETSFQALVSGDPDRFGKATIAEFVQGQPNTLAPPGTVDMIVTFRNIHNLLGSPDQAGDGNAAQAFTDWYRALKPGGILGIEEHRLPERMDSAREKTTGYVKRSTVIRLAMAAGFQFGGASEINANPKDDHDHPKGVWTLPPSYALGDTDKAKYAAIGESDRMTLRFIKPDPNAPSADAPASTPDAAPGAATTDAPATTPPATPDVPPLASTMTPSLATDPSALEEPTAPSTADPQPH